MTTRGYTPVNGVQPEPAKYGLLNSKTLAGVGEGVRWETGIAVDSLACNTSTKITSICNPSQSVSATEATGGPWTAEPFAVQTTFTCTTFGHKSQDYTGKAKNALELCQGKAVEHELWTGALGNLDVDNNNRYLASSTAVDVTPTPGTAIKPMFALALLEKALGDCGCGAEGVVHMTRSVASALEKNLQQEGDHLVTRLGTLAIAGTGYTGSGPNGTLPGGTKAWMYATGQVSVLLGEGQLVSDLMHEITDTGVNTVTATAEKDAAVGWDGCCHFAVLVDLALDYS